MAVPQEPDEEPSLWEELGVPAPKRRDESLAPEVDRELLLKFVRRELSDASARTVSHLIVAFESWAKAHETILLDEYHRTRPQGGYI